MANKINTYDRLYNNMKTRFTVTNGGGEYTLGDYMRMRADFKKTEAALPVALRTSATKSERAVAMVVSYVNDKLTIKEPPAKDKTIRAFPFRTSASAFLSAAVACAFLLSFGLLGAKVLTLSAPEISEMSISEYEDADITMRTTENA